ncbi:MAG TPA: MoaD/ThiS family protein [Longimicrobiales bacterium]|nr:MoaD/ThiS family protein [Longimicrobiales bacterium]
MTKKNTRTRPGAPAAVVVVRIPGPLRELSGGAAEVPASGRTVRAVLDDLVARHPRLRRHLRREGGGLREHVNVYVNEEDVRFLRGEKTPVSDGDALTLVASIAGG